MKVKSESEVAQSCPTLSDPMDCSLPGSSIHGVFQARVLEWGAIAFSGYLYIDIYKMHLYPLIHCGHFSCFHVLGIMNNAAMKVGVQTTLQGRDFISTGCVLRSGTARSYDSPIFNILRKRRVAFWGGCPDLLLPTVHENSLFNI